jgi:hypothetical protein
MGNRILGLDLWKVWGKIPFRSYNHSFGWWTKLEGLDWEGAFCPLFHTG